MAPCLFPREVGPGLLAVLLMQLMAGLLEAQEITTKTFDRILVGPSKHTVRETFQFPETGDIYEKVILRFSLEEPEEGWDVWDREGGLFLTGANGEEYELYRIITPYQQAWEWEADVTHFLSLFRGERDMRCTITSWSGGGYLVSARFEFHRGMVSAFPAQIVNLWNGRPDLEDANETFFQSRTLDIPSWASRVELYSVVSGHWGPNNVAEFTRTTREVKVNGSPSGRNLLWRNDCGSNPVNQQAGTWRGSRAGWCPGDPVAPWVLDVSEQALPGKTAEISYKITDPEITDHPASLGEGTHIVSSQAVFYRTLAEPFVLETDDSVVATNELESDSIIRTYHLHNPTENAISWDAMTSNRLLGVLPPRGELAAGHRVAIQVIATTAGDAFPIGSTEATFAVVIDSRQRVERTLAFIKPLIPRGAHWKYLDDGSDPGIAWRQPDYDDSGWKAGAAELGYGDGDEVTIVSFGEFSEDKFPTTYFRHAFEFPIDPSRILSGELEIKRDDGAAVYLNGQEIFRTNLPEGDITYETYADGSTGNEDRYRTKSLTDLASLMRTGTNIVAVEVHQGSSSSSDLSFDLEFAVSLSLPPEVDLPTLSIEALSENRARLRWQSSSEAEWMLHTSDDLQNWRTVSNRPDGFGNPEQAKSIDVPRLKVPTYFRLERPSD